MACKDPSEEMAYITTKSILEKLKYYSWYAKAVLTLAAFALDYGDFCKHLDKSSSPDQLTKSLGILKGIPIQPNIDQKHEGAILELNKLIKETFNFIDCIVICWRIDLLSMIERMYRHCQQPWTVSQYTFSGLS